MSSEIWHEKNLKKTAFIFFFSSGKKFFFLIVLVKEVYSKRLSSLVVAVPGWDPS